MMFVVLHLNKIKCPVSDVIKSECFKGRRNKQEEKYHFFHSNFSIEKLFFRHYFNSLSM